MINGLPRRAAADCMCPRGHNCIRGQHVRLWMNRCTVAEQWQLNGNARGIPRLLPRFHDERSRFSALFTERQSHVRVATTIFHSLPREFVDVLFENLSRFVGKWTRVSLANVNHLHCFHHSSLKPSAVFLSSSSVACGKRIREKVLLI